MNKFKENWVFIIGMIIILGTHLVSCCKEPLPPVVESEELEPTLELSVAPEGVIPYGDKNVVLNWTTTNANQVLVNGERQPSAKTGIKTICNRIFKDTTFLVKAINKKKIIEKSITLKVGPWSESVFGRVSKFSWKYKAQRISREGVILANFWLDEEELSWVVYYHRDGRLTYSSNLSSSIDSWDLPDDNTITLNGETFKLQVTTTEMIISYEVMFNGEPAWFDMVFEHASDIPTDSE